MFSTEVDLDIEAWEMQIKILFKFALYLLIVTSLTGCPQQKGEDGSGKEKSKRSAEASSGGGALSVKKKSRYPVDDLAATAVVIKVNGQPITQADYRKWFKLRDRIYRAMQRLSPTEKNDKTAAFARDSRQHVLFELIRRELMRQEAERLGVVVDEKRIRRLEKEFMEAIHRPKEPFSSIGKYFEEPWGTALRESIFKDARESATLEKSTTNNLVSVTDEEVDRYIKYIKEWNKEAEAKNKVQREKALKAKHDILNGGYFYAITTNRADLAKEDGLDWQTVELGEFQADEPLAKWLMTAKPGDISDPIDMEDGLAIVGLKAAYMGDAPPDSPPAMQYELVRCTFYAYDKYDEPEDRAEFARDVVKERRKVALEALGKRLWDSAKIEFPYGVKIFKPRAKKKVKKANKPVGASATNGVEKTKSLVTPKEKKKDAPVEKQQAGAF